MVVDAFLKKKWDRVFYTFFDTNKNKVIDWNDFELVFTKIKELRGEDSTEYKIVEDAMGMVWRGLLEEAKGIDMLKDVSTDTVVSIDEWDKMWEKFNPKRLHIWQWEYLKYMFFLIDTSGDKFIDKTEYAQVMTMYGLDKAAAEKAFMKFAVDENNKKIEKINYGQFVRLFNEYFASPDKTKPGSFLFGDW